MTSNALQLWPTMRRVERAACNCVVRCVRTLGLKEAPVPIPVEDWVEGPLGVKFGIADLSHLGPDVLGAVFVAQREILVSDSITNQEGRFRFTVAHELGHLILHSKLAPTFHETTDQSDYINRRIERDADRFAAAFLMPVPLLCREFNLICNSVNIEPLKLLQSLACAEEWALRAFRAAILPKVARRFVVSTTVALRRFADVQLPDGAQALPAELLTLLLKAEQPRGAPGPR